MSSLERAWYGPRRWLWLLWPVQALMRVLVAFRRRAYRLGWFASFRVRVPVIVIGNITVGGTGKTPLTAFVIKQLQAMGYRPGIISRGYGGKAPFYPFAVTANIAADLCGDEPLLLARQTQVPVIVDPDRVRGAQALCEQACDVIVSDDGLQHYRLQRDIEIAVIDAVRQVGNGWLLPAGPLREPLSRLQQVDIRVANGPAIPMLGEHGMRLQMSVVQSLNGAPAQDIKSWQGKRVHAVAGIGNPERFFRQLEALGLTVERHAFPDHYFYQAADFAWRDAAIVMTEKDAVKCQTLNLPDAWYVPVEAELSPAFIELLQTKLSAVNSKRKLSK